jgi:hypothetical protein
MAPSILWHSHSFIIIHTSQLELDLVLAILVAG